MTSRRRSSEELGHVLIKNAQDPARGCRGTGTHLVQKLLVAMCEVPHTLTQATVASSRHRGCALRFNQLPTQPGADQVIE
jgi:hypothetical protein